MPLISLHTLPVSKTVPFIPPSTQLIEFLKNGLQRETLMRKKKTSDLIGQTHDGADRIVETLPPRPRGTPQAQDDFGVRVHLDQVVDEHGRGGVDGGLDVGGGVELVQEFLATGFVVVQATDGLPEPGVGVREGVVDDVLPEGVAGCIAEHFEGVVEGGCCCSGEASLGGVLV